MIQFSFQFTEDTLIKAFILHYNKSLKSRIIRWCAVLVFYFALIWILINLGFNIRTIYFIFLSIFILLIPNIMLNVSMKQFRKNSAYGKLTNFKISDEIFMASGDGFETKMDWNTIYAVYISPTGILVYPQENNFYWLPREKFENREQYMHFISMLKEKVKTFKVSVRIDDHAYK